MKELITFLNWKKSNFPGWEIEDVLEYYSMRKQEFYSDEHTSLWSDFYQAYGEGNHEEASIAFKGLQQLNSSESSVIRSLKIQLDSLTEKII